MNLPSSDVVREDNGAVRGLLRQRGWDSYGTYQEFWGLNIDGWAGPITTEHLQRRRICSLPDALSMRGPRIGTTPPRFADSNIKWWVSHRDEDVRRAFAVAWQQWANVCDIRPIKGSDGAVVVSNFGRVDRPGGTLAWSELAPLDGRKFLRQRYDHSEDWQLSPDDVGGISLVAVACHEIGHALGIGHISGDTGDLMNPIYSPDIRSPQAGDIREAVARYGPPAGTDTPGVGAFEIRARIKGVEYMGVMRPSTENE